MPIARRSAADANLVILSFSGIIELPARVKDWIERWARFANSQNSALVTLMDHKAKVAGPPRRIPICAEEWNPAKSISSRTAPPLFA
jgi:hypothetical protein